MGHGATELTDLESMRTEWMRQWPTALAAWSRFVRLSPPRWCMNPEDEAREQLVGSFAMIRLVDHAVVISLRQVRERGLMPFAVEIMAHEIGHHVYTPADLSDNALVQARIRAGLPTKEQHAGMIANLYEDLLINDRLQRSANLDLAGVYRKLAVRTPSRLWTFYMRIYEVLWKLESGSLAPGEIDARLNLDAQLGARLIRSYAKHWLDGAGRFAVLCLTYLLADNAGGSKSHAPPWWDTLSAGAGGLPDGLTEIDSDEQGGAIHPSEDPILSGIESDNDSAAGSDGGSPLAGQESGRKSERKYRDPFEYAAVIRATGANLSDDQIVARYYRERALPHLIRFPTRQSPQATDPLPEGFEVWDVGSPLEEIDWSGTLMNGPVVIPGETTRRRIYGDSPGTTPEHVPLDLYLGVDCSGSMQNPAHSLSYPVLAGAIIALSALRTGSRVMAVLSGEPGRTIATDGFIRDENLIFKILTGYLGSGTTFGIHRLRETFDNLPRGGRAVHILIVTDGDIFSMLDSSKADELGWDVARESLDHARGGGTYVLHLPANTWGRFGDVGIPSRRMEEDGWNVSRVSSQQELIDFARRFSQARYGN